MTTVRRSGITDGPDDAATAGRGADTADGLPPLPLRVTVPVGPDAPPPAMEWFCPVDGPARFDDDFGAPRPGGRAHEGIDLTARRGTPLVAVRTGTIVTVDPADDGPDDLTGIGLTLRADDGHRFFYAHLDSLERAASRVGNRVEAGQRIGTLGQTGNARFSIPHLHFEHRHPGSDRPVDPYFWLAVACR